MAPGFHFKPSKSSLMSRVEHCLPYFCIYIHSTIHRLYNLSIDAKKQLSTTNLELKNCVKNALLIANCGETQCFQACLNMVLQSSLHQQLKRRP